MFHGRTIVRALAQAVPNFTSAFGERKKRGHSESHEEDNRGGKRATVPEEPRGQRLSIVTNQQIKDLDFLGAEIPAGSPIPLNPLRAHAHTGTHNINLEVHI